MLTVNHLLVRLSWAVWLGVILSAVGVVWSSHETRLRVERLEVLRREAATMHEDWGKFLLERSTWSAYGRVEQLAVEKMQMKAPDQSNWVVVEP